MTLSLQLDTTPVRNAAATAVSWLDRIVRPRRVPGPLEQYKRCVCTSPAGRPSRLR